MRAATTAPSNHDGTVRDGATKKQAGVEPVARREKVTERLVWREIAAQLREKEAA